MLMRDKPQTESSNHVEMQLESPRHVNVRDWLNLARGSIVTDAPGNSTLPKEEPFVVDSAKVAGIKRQRSDSSQYPTYDKSITNGCTTEHLVHAHKKHKIEHENSNEFGLCGKKQSNDFKEECVPICHLPLESSFPPICGERSRIPSFSSFQPTCEERPRAPSISTFQPTCIHPTVTFKSPSSPHSSAKPISGFPMEGSNESIMTIGSPILVNRHETSNLHWKDRFLQVQAFLKACDESCQEDYIQMLRSLSSADRSNHAAALEKRAIHLLLEEGKELHLMKVLNVFGNASSVDQITLSVDKPSLVAKE